MVIPTLTADARLRECVESLARQTRQDFEVIIVDNSGTGLVRRQGAAPGARVIENGRNAGFGAAINQGFAASVAPYLATLNDDTVAHPQWLDALLRAAEGRPDIGMFASQVRFFGEPRLDSAGMLIARDGSSKQRGHGRQPEDFPVPEEVLFPSGSAALYRRSMLEQTGGFDAEFFLYCEDTDLGLRARWAGWKCLYVPRRRSGTPLLAFRRSASSLKAYYVERNRLFVLVKNFPGRMLLAAPFVDPRAVSLARLVHLARPGQRGAFSRRGQRRAQDALVRGARARAHCSATWLACCGSARQIRRRARITPAVFRHLLRSHAISARRMAAHVNPARRRRRPDSLLVIVPALNEEARSPAWSARSSNTFPECQSW